MFKAIFLQLGSEEGMYDIFMGIGEYFMDFQMGLSDFASNLFGSFGF